MSTGSSPGSPACYVNLAGTSDHPHGGRDLPQPRPTSRRIQVVASDHPSTDLWIVLTTVRLAPSPLYRVGVVDGRNLPAQPPRDYPTLRRARNAANRLYKQHEEN